MTKAEEMVLKTVHDLGVAGDWDVCNYTGLSPASAGWALDALYRKGYLKIAARRYQCDVNARDKDDIGITFVGNLWEFAPKGRKAAQKIPDIDEPQPDGIQFRTVDDLGRICIPKNIRDKLGIKPGTECAVYSTDELTSEEIIVIRQHETGGQNEGKLD